MLKLCVDIVNYRLLDAAILRINASLDLNTVLNEVVDSAGALTGSRYGMIATVDDAGGLQEFLTSGLAPDEQRQIADWSVRVPVLRASPRPSGER